MMNFSVIGEHRDFFRCHHWIECEGVVSPTQLEVFSKEIVKGLSTRIKERRGITDPNLVFAAGRDLWRALPVLKKIVTQKSLGQIASELIEHKPLRLGYDQFFPSLGDSSGPYEKFLDQTLTLEELSSIQGVLCGLMLCVTPPHTDAPESMSTNVFPANVEDGVFFAPNLPIDFSVLKAIGGEYLLIVYVDAKATYCRQECDPNGHSFKDLNYSYRDKLLDTLNPIVYR